MSCFDFPQGDSDRQYLDACQETEWERKKGGSWIQLELTSACLQIKFCIWSSHDKLNTVLDDEWWKYTHM